MIQKYYFLIPKALKPYSSWEICWLQNQAKTMLHSNLNDQYLQINVVTPFIIAVIYAFLNVTTKHFSESVAFYKIF